MIDGKCKAFFQRINLWKLSQILRLFMILINLLDFTNTLC